MKKMREKKLKKWGQRKKVGTEKKERNEG